MKLVVCAVFDKTVKAYMVPFFVRTKEEGIRTFMDACKSKDSAFSKYPKDFELFCVGEWDDQSSMFSGMDVGHLISALDAIPPE